MKRRARDLKKVIDVQNIKYRPAYSGKLIINERKKSDIQYLIKSNHIPKYYGPFYESLFQ